MRRRRGLTAALVALVLAPGAYALDLDQAWQAAQQHDLDYAAARAAHDAAQARRSQARALWRPNVTASGTVGRMNNTTDVSGAHFAAPGLGASNGVNFDTSVTGGTSSSWVLSARQPLLSGERWAQSAQLDLAADAADRQWQATRQSLMLQTAQRYFDVVIAQETLRVLGDQQAAAEQALAQARERYRIGDSPVTDSHEAQARAQAVRAQVLAAQTELQLKQIELADMTGVAPQELALAVPDFASGVQDPGPLDHWLEAAERDNPDLLRQAAGTAVARQDVARLRAISSPSLDLVARFGRDRLSGSGDYGAAANTANSAMIGLQLTVPVFTGGYRSAQHDEAVGMAEKSRDDEARARQRVALQTRSAWLGLTVGATRVDALAAALQASQARLEATRLGHEVGDRSTLELLAAQSDAAAAELALLQGRIGLVMERLRLAALAGALDEEHFRAAVQGAAPR